MVGGRSLLSGCAPLIYLFANKSSGGTLAEHESYQFIIRFS